MLILFNTIYSQVYLVFCPAVVRECVCARECVCVCARECVRVCARARECVCARASVCDLLFPTFGHTYVFLYVSIYPIVGKLSLFSKYLLYFLLYFSLNV